MEILKFIIHCIGIFIIIFLIDFDRKESIVSLFTFKGWSIIIIVALASVLIQIEL